MIVTRIEADKGKDKKRVAAYARVSTLLEEQDESFETQIRYYSRLIQTKKEWEFVGVYTDHGRSGVNTKDRPGFLQMMKAARKKEIDLILVKSISRFARNAKEAQEYVHELKSLNVEVYFDREEISSFNPSADMIFCVLAAMAQEEIRSVSDRVKWSNQKLLEQDIRHIGSNRILGYDEVNGKLLPNKDAWIVKLAFREYEMGVRVSDIAKHLNNMGAVTLRAKGVFTAAHIKNMIRNVIYVGDRLLQQSPPRNYMTHKPDLSISYMSKYITNDHEGIIARRQWNEAQKRLKQFEARKEKGINSSEGSHYLFGSVYCSVCGAPFTRRTIKKGGQMTKVWKCKERLRGKKGNGCKNIIISEEKLLHCISESLGWEWTGVESFNKDEYLKIVLEVNISCNGDVVVIQRQEELSSAED